MLFCTKKAIYILLKIYKMIHTITCRSAPLLLTEMDFAFKRKLKDYLYAVYNYILYAITFLHAIKKLDK